MTDAPPPPTFARRALAVLVGAFAVWQLAFIPAANLIDFVPRRVGPPLEPIADGYQRRGAFTSVEPVQRAADSGGAALDFWSEVSGQEQGWSLFAPGMPPYSVVPAVEFVFNDGSSDTLLSDYEPADKLNPRLRPPLLDNRVFNVEAQLMVPVWFAPPEEVAARYVQPAELAQLPAVYRTLPAIARKWRGPIRAYLAWQLKAYVAAHPDRPAPTDVILKHRFIPTPKPSDPRGWTRPISERPYAKWQPTVDSYAVYDILNKRFVSVEARP